MTYTGSYFSNLYKPAQEIVLIDFKMPTEFSYKAWKNGQLMICFNDRAMSDIYSRQGYRVTPGWIKVIEGGK